MHDVVAEERAERVADDDEVCDAGAEEVEQNHPRHRLRVLGAQTLEHLHCGYALSSGGRARALG